MKILCPKCEQLIEISAMDCGYRCVHCGGKFYLKPCGSTMDLPSDFAGLLKNSSAIRQIDDRILYSAENRATINELKIRRRIPAVERSEYGASYLEPETKQESSPPESSGALLKSVLLIILIVFCVGFCFYLYDKEQFIFFLAEVCSVIDRILNLF